MSGGVDSSVAAALLQRAGHEVVGCFMRLGSPDEEERLVPGDDDCAAPAGGGRGCCSVGDAADARLVAARLGIPLYVCNFRRDFGRIVDHFVAEYNAGRTPNPCARCNDWLKFGRLHEHAESLGCAFVASGHHARIDHGDPENPRLCCGRDAGKDQSYYLFGLPVEKRRAMLLPVGEMEKSAVRAIARELGLAVAEKPDSQEICFVPDDDYAGLVRRRTPDAVAPGAIEDRAGRRLGTHPGHQHFTIGQRRGVGVALGHPIYVVERDPARNVVVVGDRADLRRSGCTAGQAIWHEPPTETWRPCSARIRANAAARPARVRSRGSTTIEVRFDEPVEAVAPGQAVVCYDGDRVLCGGWIDVAHAAAS